MAQDFAQIQNRINSLTAHLTVVKEDTIRLMKELEQLSALLPERAKKKKVGPLSEADLARLTAKRLSKIKSI